MDTIKELSQYELQSINGGAASWGETGAGFAAVAIGIAIAATPVGLVGMAGAAAFSYFGGTLIGSGLSGNDVWDLSSD